MARVKSGFLWILPTSIRTFGQRHTLQRRPWLRIDRHLCLIIQSSLYEKWIVLNQR